MQIDAYVSAPWYLDHLLPVWRALPAALRGRFYLAERVGVGPAGIPRAVVGPPTEGSDPIVVVSHGDLLHARKAGRTLIALGQHGAGQSYSNDHQSFPGGRNQDDVGLFLVPNATAAGRTLERYPEARVAVIGCPKLDGLPPRARRRAGAAPVVAVSFHWDGRSIAPELRPAWRWYRGALRDVAKRWTVIGHGHPRYMAGLERIYREAGVEVVRSFSDVLRRADVYVCDNSSSLFEFASTGRGVVVLNTPLMRRDREHGLRFWAAADVGVQVDRAPQLVPAVGRALEDPPKIRARREAALDIVYQPRTGGARLAADALADWAIDIGAAARLSSAPAG